MYQKREEKMEMTNLVPAYLFEVNDDPAVPPLDDEIRVDLDREVAVVDLEDLEVVEADAHVQRLGGTLLAPRVDRRHVSEGRNV